MKKITLIMLFSLIAGSTQANLTAILTYPDQPSQLGGPYNVKLTGDKTQIFQTFCVESHVLFATQKEYSVTIDDKVLYGGSDPQTLEDATKKLYAAFINGDIVASAEPGSDAIEVGYSYRDLQNAFWALESNGSPLFDDTGSFENSLVQVWMDDSGIVTRSNLLVELDFTGWQNVKVLNLWHKGDEYGYDIQSHLIMIPAPAAILLGSIGVGIVGYLKRRRSL